MAALLSRTRSQEVNVAESVAAQDFPIGEGSEQTLHEEEYEGETSQWPWTVKYLVLFCGFITSLSFGTTQVPLLYVFRLMTCDAYYEDHPEQTVGLEDSARSPVSTGTTSVGSMVTYALSAGELFTTADIPPISGRCSVHEIESSTALNVSLLGASTTIFGLVNLFLTGVMIKRIGIKPTLWINIFIPAVRLLIQNVGVEVWGNTGIIIVQCSQVITILGGPSGYILTLNTFVTEIIDYEGRTAWLGRLMGSMMVGAALGFLLGGVVAEAFDIKAPFRLTLALFLAASVYIVIFLPRVAAADSKAGDSTTTNGKKKGVLRKFFGPLAVFAPRKFITKAGAIQTEYGAFLLAWGVFLGILATGYLVTLLQLFSTDVFGFGTKENGWLIFMYSLLRGLFLTFLFPRFIAIGRRLTLRKQKEENKKPKAANVPEEPEAPSERQPLLSHEQNGADGTEPEADQHKNNDSVKKPEQTFTFDLTYTRFSLIADGLLTLLCTFVREGWQMYLVAAILPFAAGTGSAAKGTVLQMVGRDASSGERTDALAGVSLVENIARLSTSE